MSKENDQLYACAKEIEKVLILTLNDLRMPMMAKYSLDQDGAEGALSTAALMAGVRIMTLHCDATDSEVKQLIFHRAHMISRFMAEKIDEAEADDESEDSNG
jgi:hypothetical protein